MTMRQEKPWVLDGKKVLVVGAAATGIAAGRFLASKGAVVTLTDRMPESGFPGLREQMAEIGVNVEFGPHKEETFVNTDGIVLSPGVPVTLDVLKEARRRGVDIAAEIELAGWFLKAPLLAVTGTNGKSTTTTLIGSALEKWGKKAFVGGNLGTPLITAAAPPDDYEFIVAEVSSFQLKETVLFHPKVGVLLNLTEDHLDWHLDFEDYALSKGKLFSRQGPEDAAVANLDDPEVRKVLGESQAMRVLGFSMDPDRPAEAVWDGEKIRFKKEGQEETIVIEGASLWGDHGAQVLMAALLSVSFVGCPVEHFVDAVKSFKVLEHRMEFVCAVKGVRYINDSKATNAGAAAHALNACSRPVVLIAGGKDKGIDFGVLNDPIRKKAKAVVLFGEAAERMEQTFSGIVPIHRTADMQEAVSKAAALAEPGDIVLLSPACSSFDQYRNYEIRGADFKRAVNRLVKEENGVTRA